MPQNEGVTELIRLLQADSKWVDPPQEGAGPQVTRSRAPSANLGRGTRATPLPVLP